MKKLIVILLILSGIFFAEETANVGVYVLNAVKFDVQTGTYSVDFYLSYVCSSNCSPNFEFSNGRATSVDKLIDTPTEKFYRIQASLQDPVDFSRFPFDRHTLSIQLEDKYLKKDDLRYVVDMRQSGIEPGIQFVGWQLKNWSSHVEDHYYPPYGETFSKYVFNINLQRETISSLLKVFIPVMFIMLLNFFAHFPDPDKITNRITMHATFITAAVMFHVAIGNQLPPVGYLTVADKFMFAAYLPLAFSMLSAIVILELVEEKRTDWVAAVHKASGPLSFLLWIAGLAVVYFTM